MNDQPITEPETEEGKGLYLGMQLMAASQAGLNATMDTLYEGERQHRMALEVLIDIFLDHADAAHMGTVREYEQAIDIVRYKGKSGPGVDLEFYGGNWIEVLSRRHPEFSGSL